MQFLDALHTYFRGEKLEAWFFIFPVGVLLLAFAAVALKVERGGFAWGVAIPCVLAGLALIGTGIGVGSRTSGQVKELVRGYETAPSVDQFHPALQHQSTGYDRPQSLLYGFY